MCTLKYDMNNFLEDEENFIWICFFARSFNDLSTIDEIHCKIEDKYTKENHFLFKLRVGYLREALIVLWRAIVNKIIDTNDTKIKEMLKDILPEFENDSFNLKILRNDRNDFFHYVDTDESKRKIQFEKVKKQVLEHVKAKEPISLEINRSDIYYSFADEILLGSVLTKNEKENNLNIKEYFDKVYKTTINVMKLFKYVIEQYFQNKNHI